MENMPEFTLHRPDTAAEVAVKRKLRLTSRYLAGGTDMIVNVRRGIETPETMIDLTAIADIAAIARMAMDHDRRGREACRSGRR